MNKLRFKPKKIYTISWSLFEIFILVGLILKFQTRPLVLSCSDALGIVIVIITLFFLTIIIFSSVSISDKEVKFLRRSFFLSDIQRMEIQQFRAGRQLKFITKKYVIIYLPIFILEDTSKICYEIYKRIPDKGVVGIDEELLEKIKEEQEIEAGDKNGIEKRRQELRKMAKEKVIKENLIIVSIMSGIFLLFIILKNGIINKENIYALIVVVGLYVFFVPLFVFVRYLLSPEWFYD
jgi:hypothetical protein